VQTDTAVCGGVSKSGAKMIQKIPFELDRQIRKLAGTMSDRALGEQLGVSKAAVQVRRAAEGKPGYRFVGRYKKKKEEQARFLRPGFTSLITQDAWQENYEIQCLLYRWKRCV